MSDEDFYSAIENFSVELKKAKRNVSICAEKLGGVAKTCLSEHKERSDIIRMLVEIHSKIAKIHLELGKSFEIVKEKYSAIRQESINATTDCTKNLEDKKSEFLDTWQKIDVQKEKIDNEIFKLIEKENALFTSVLKEYHTALSITTKMKEIDLKLNAVFFDFSEIIGRIDELSNLIRELSGKGAGELGKDFKSLKERREELYYIR
ncbi:MAG: hypothetical protein AB1779_08705 [Candidatus Thermoplasmatota archaeon]